MRTTRFMTAAAVMLALGAPVFADRAADEDAIRKATELRDAAANAKDVEAYLSFFDEGCTAGWDSRICYRTVKELGKFPEMWINAKTTIYEGGDIVFVTPDVAIYRFTLHRSGFLNADGSPLPEGDYQTATIFVKKDGKWLLAAGGFNREID